MMSQEKSMSLSAEVFWGSIHLRVVCQVLKSIL